MLITQYQLQNIATRLTPEKALKISNLLCSICPLYGINTADIFHEFIANVLHESGEFTTLEENLNYSAKALRSLFGKHRISDSECELYGRTNTHPANKEMIANTIYGGQWGKVNLGNTQQGDGWIFRGSGAIQNTGRSNITKFTTYYNARFGTSFTPEQMAELLRLDMAISIHSACWFFSIAKNLIQLAIDDKMKEITQRINGGQIGMNERLHYLNLAEKYII